MTTTDLKYLVKRTLRPKFCRPRLGLHPSGGPQDSIHTLVMVVRHGFDAGVPRACSTIRLGYCKAFAALGIKYRLVSSFDLERSLRSIESPIVFLTVYDYFDFGGRTRRALRRYPHFVWASGDREIMQEVYSRFNAVADVVSDKIYELVAQSEPSFVWVPAPEGALDAYSNWRKTGLTLRSLPLACDTDRYFPDDDHGKFSDVLFGTVGGYWANKAIQLDRFLRPHEDSLVVFGNRVWPYKGYRGAISEDDERVLYSNARVCAAINEPHAEVTGDIVERVYKVLGCGGVAVTDTARWHRELFSPDELLMPSTVDEFHDMVNAAMTDGALNQRYRSRGREAVLQRHTYQHRARAILGWLGICDTVAAN